ncbi:MAG: hypothetical protein WCV90_07740 [Candidatus Woesearchaeota archaeon]
MNIEKILKRTLIVASAIVALTWTYNFGHDRGYSRGYDRGVEREALDFSIACYTGDTHRSIGTDKALRENGRSLSLNFSGRLEDQYKSVEQYAKRFSPEVRQEAYSKIADLREMVRDHYLDINLKQVRLMAPPVVTLDDAINPPRSEYVSPETVPNETLDEVLNPPVTNHYRPEGSFKLGQDL